MTAVGVFCCPNLPSLTASVRDCGKHLLPEPLRRPSRVLHATKRSSSGRYTRDARSRSVALVGVVRHQCGDTLGRVISGCWSLGESQEVDVMYSSQGGAMAERVGEL